MDCEVCRALNEIKHNKTSIYMGTQLCIDLVNNHPSMVNQIIKLEKERKMENTGQPEPKLITKLGMMWENGRIIVTGRLVNEKGLEIANSNLLARAVPLLQKHGLEIESSSSTLYAKKNNVSDLDFIALRANLKEDGFVLEF